MDKKHNPPIRRIKKFINDFFHLTNSWQSFLHLIHDASRGSNTDHEMQKRSYELSSQEMIETNKAMQKAQAELEKLVEERTADLARTNERLKEEIVDRERTEEALDRERRLLRTVIDNIPDQIFARDTNCRFTLNNLSDARAAGVSDPATLLGKSDNDFYPNDLADRYQADDRMVMETGQPLIDREEPSLGPNNTRRWLLTTKVPLRDSQGQVIGVVGIARDITRQKRTEEDLQKAHAELESRVAERTAELASANERLQMENAERKRAEDKLRHRLNELEALHTVSINLRTAKTRDEALPILLHETLVALETDAGSIWLYFPDSNELRSAADRGWFLQMRGASIEPGEEIVGSVFANGKSYISAEFRSDPLTHAATREHMPPGRGGVCVPIHTGTVTIGVLIVSMPFTQSIASEQVQLLESIAEMAGATLHRMSLHEETVRQLNRMQALYSMDQAIIASTDLPLTLNILLDHVATQLKVDAADVLLINSSTLTLEYAAARGFRTRAVEHASVCLGNGFAGRVAMERRAVRLKKPPKLQESPQFASLWAEEGFVEAYAVPLIAKGQVKGVLELFHRSPLVIEREWVDFMEMLAGQAVIAIEDAQLFDSLQRSNLDLAQAYDATIEGWSRALDLRDKETEGHTKRVTEMTVKLANAMGINDSEIINIRRGALLHDIGKMGVPDSILHKPGALNDEEWQIMRQHPQLAYDMLSPIAYLKPALDIPYCHHERWDGKGYPRGLMGEEIPLAARIFSVVDVWDALSSNRPYRAAWPKEKVIKYIRAESGKHFDPNVIDIFLKASK
jgi:PAS domain S-box-containing protein/putative nucleotidyltransferase with HDIG domain